MNIIISVNTNPKNAAFIKRKVEELLSDPSTYGDAPCTFFDAIEQYNECLGVVQLLGVEVDESEDMVIEILRKVARSNETSDYPSAARFLLEKRYGVSA